MAFKEQGSGAIWAAAFEQWQNYYSRQLSHELGWRVKPFPSLADRDRYWPEPHYFKRRKKTAEKTT